MKIRFICLILAIALTPLSVKAKQAAVYVSLSYDDALTSQLENAVPALQHFQFLASFYLVPTNPGFIENTARWATLSSQGHELGNHSYTHPCRGSLPDREWVASDNDLDTLSVSEMQQQVIKANAVLHQLDGAATRTYTIPCGDTQAAGENYLGAIEPHVYAIKGRALSPGQEVIIAPSGTSGKMLVNLLTQQPEAVKIINIIFHGIGGDYLSVSSEAHHTLLAYLDAHRDKYKVDTYLAITREVLGD